MIIPIRKPKKKKSEETILLNAVRDFFRWNLWKVIRFQQGLGSHPGIPDLCIMRDGIFAWIEIKTPKGKMSEAQIAFESDCLDANINHHIVRSFDDAIKINKFYLMKT